MSVSSLVNCSSECSVPVSVSMTHLRSKPGNLYYALTHSPEPLSDEEEFTLSWQAATKRLEAAGSIPVEEARLMTEALQSKEAGIEVRREGIHYSFGDWTRLTLYSDIPATLNRG